MGKGTGAEGFDAFKASVEGAAVSEEAKEIAELYANAKKAMIVFQQNVVTTEAAALLGDIAVVFRSYRKSPRRYPYAESKEQQPGSC